MKISLTKTALFSKLNFDNKLTVKQLLIPCKSEYKKKNLSRNTRSSMFSETKEKEHTRCFSNESLFPSTHMQTSNNIFNSTNCITNNKTTYNNIHALKQQLLTSFTCCSMSSSNLNIRHNHKHNKHLHRSGSINGKYRKSEQNRVSVLPGKVMEIYKKGIPGDMILQYVIPVNKIQTETQAQSFPIISSKKMVKNMLPREYDYNRVKKPEEVIKDSYHVVVRNEKKLMNKHINAVNKLITHDYNSNFGLVEKKNFSAKYIKNDTVLEMEKEPKFKEMISRLINKNFKLKAEVLSVINDTNQKRDDVKKRKLYLRYRQVMIRAAIHFQKLDITIEEFYNRKRDMDKISKYEYNKNKLLIRAIKAKDLEGIVKMVKNNSFIVLDCDMFQQAPIHWAAKRNFYEVIPLLVNRGANPSIKDETGRTPLHIASKCSYKESVMMLLYEMANPVSKNNKGEMPIDLVKDKEIKKMLEKGRYLHKLAEGSSPVFYENLVRRGLDQLFLNDMRTNWELIKQWLSR